VRLEVSDRGPRFAPDDPEATFARHGTTGGRDPLPVEASLEPDPRVLGLQLVRLLARSLGGQAWVSNGQAGGTVVTVDLPQRRQDD
jgi:signal transduction histidine kinase